MKNIFVDTDGDFNRLIPQFIAAGVDGFLPMDVNAGMDIVKVRELYPRLGIGSATDAVPESFFFLLVILFIRAAGTVA